jgi:hypothetical protein
MTEIELRLRLPWWWWLWIRLAYFNFCVGIPVDVDRVAKVIVDHCRIDVVPNGRHRGR